MIERSLAGDGVAHRIPALQLGRQAARLPLQLGASVSGELGVAAVEAQQRVYLVWRHN